MDIGALPSARFQLSWRADIWIYLVNEEPVQKQN